MTTEEIDVEIIRVQWRYRHAKWADQPDEALSARAEQDRLLERRHQITTNVVGRSN